MRKKRWASQDTPRDLSGAQPIFSNLFDVFSTLFDLILSLFVSDFGYYNYYYYYDYYRLKTNRVLLANGGLVIWARSRVGAKTRVRAKTICCRSALRCRHFWSWP